MLRERHQQLQSVGWDWIRFEKERLISVEDRNAELNTSAVQHSAATSKTNSIYLQNKIKFDFIQ